MPPDLTTTVLLRGEDSGGHVSAVENVVAPLTAGPPLHSHDFDETFYLLDGELAFRIGDQLLTRTAGQLAFAPRGVGHALTNRHDARAVPARLHPRRLRTPVRPDGCTDPRRRPATLGAAADSRSRDARSTYPPRSPQPPRLSRDETIDARASPSDRAVPEGP